LYYEDFAGRFAKKRGITAHISVRTDKQRFAVKLVASFSRT